MKLLPTYSFYDEPTEVIFFHYESNHEYMLDEDYLDVTSDAHSTHVNQIAENIIVRIYKGATQGW